MPRDDEADSQQIEGWEPPFQINEPFKIILIRRIQEVQKLVMISTASLRSMNGLTDLGEAMHYSPDRIAEMRQLEAEAKAQIDSDFPLLNSAAILLLWGALETAIKDYVSRALFHYPSTRTVDLFRGIKVRIADYEALEEADKTRLLVDLIERDARLPARNGPEKLDRFLSVLNVCPKIDNTKRRDLLEMWAVRNVIAHCASVADERFVSICPWLNLRVRDPVPVSTEALRRYMTAVGEYAAATLRAGKIALKHFADTEAARAKAGS